MAGDDVPMTADVFVTAPAATARAATATPQVWVKTGTIAATGVASAPAAVVIGSSVVLTYVVAVDQHYHVPADHHDPIALGTEFGLVLVVIFVGWKLVACRLIHPSR
jgi:hypothetical protein